MTYQKQLEILEAMQSKGFNVCNCGNCGGIILFDKETKPSLRNDIADEVTCPHCERTLGYSDCPDLYYEGMPELNN